MRRARNTAAARPPERARRAWAILSTALAFALWLPAQSAPKPTEYQVKAAYISNFGRFVGWPGTAPASDSFNVCVLGQDPFGPALDMAIAGESIGHAPMAARRITDVEEAANCRIVFISGSEDFKTVLPALGKTAVLTVSDAPEFVKGGGMIQFVLDGNRVRFEINLGAAKRVGLSLSSELLKVAMAVRNRPRHEP